MGSLVVFKGSFSLQEKTINGVVANNAQMLADNGVLQYVYLQTSEMKDAFSKFPEHVCIDCTYSVNDRDMPLMSFVVVDGHNMTRFAACALIVNETGPMLEEILDLFRSTNPAADRTSSFMTDKDLICISKLEAVFPNAKCELCLFHVKQAFRRKTGEMDLSSLKREKIRNILDKMVESRTVEQYEGFRASLLCVDAQFSRYFEENWEPRKASWVHCYREKVLNLGDTTNNRIESYHQKLKSEMPRKLPLDLCIQKIVFVAQFLEDKCRDRQFEAATKRPFASPWPELLGVVTPYALSVAESEVSKASSIAIQPLPGGCFSTEEPTGRVRTCKSDGGCHCRVTKTMLIPCRHVIAVRRHLGLPPLEPSLFAARWLVANNCDLQMTSNQITTQNVAVVPFDWKGVANSRRDRYALVKGVVSSLMQKLLSLDFQRCSYYCGLLEKFEEKVEGLESFHIVTDEVEGGSADVDGGDDQNDGNAHDGESDPRPSTPGSSAEFNEESDPAQPGSSAELEQAPAQPPSLDGVAASRNDDPVQPGASREVGEIENDAPQHRGRSATQFMQSLLLRPSPLSPFRSLQPPAKVAKRGRSKGSDLSAIGLPKKKKKKN